MRAATLGTKLAAAALGFRRLHPLSFSCRTSLRRRSLLGQRGGEGGRRSLQPELFHYRRVRTQLETQNPGPPSQEPCDDQHGPSKGTPKGYAAATARPSGAASHAHLQLVAALGRQNSGPKAIEPTLASLQALVPNAGHPQRLYRAANQEVLWA